MWTFNCLKSCPWEEILSAQNLAQNTDIQAFYVWSVASYSWCETEVTEGMELHLVNHGCLCSQLYRAEPLDLSLLGSASLPWSYTSYRQGRKVAVVGVPLCLHCTNSWVFLGVDSTICGEKISFARLCRSCIWTYKNL